MGLSARNRLSGTITDLDTDGLMAQVTVELDDGQQVTSVITSGSVDRLGLEAGDDVNAVVKATEVMIQNDA